MRIHRASGAAVALVLLATLACHSPTETDPGHPLTLDLSATELRVGDTQEVRVTNRGDEDAFYSFCELTLQLRDGTRWVTLASLRLCVGGFSELDPGASAIAPTPMERAGTLRFRMPFRAHPGAPTGFLLSQPFRVTAE